MPMKPLDHDLRLAFEKRLKNAQFGWSGKKIDLFFLVCIGGGGEQQARLFVSFFPVIGQLMLFHFI